MNVDGDSGGFLALGAALNGNTNDNIQATRMYRFMEYSLLTIKY